MLAKPIVECNIFYNIEIEIYYQILILISMILSCLIYNNIILMYRKLKIN